MALALYLDDCSNSALLAELLRQAGHTVTLPVDAGLAGADDDIHFQYALTQGLTIITKNPADFHELHMGNPAHQGVLAVCQDNHVDRDMSDAEIVKAIENLENAVELGGQPIPGHFHVLNNWRY